MDIGKKVTNDIHDTHVTHVPRIMVDTSLDDLTEIQDPESSAELFHEHSKREISIVSTGSVDSGKSSLLGVLATGKLDDGNGSARLHIAKHPHEKKLGKTSDIATKSVNFDGKNICFIDLCGHEKYLKTTLYGITGYFPDYGLLVIAANRGILKMTREHMGILLYLKIPFIIVVTRIDIAPENIYNDTINDIKKILKKFGKNVVILNNMSDSKLYSDRDTDNLNKLKLKEQEALNTAVKSAHMMHTNPNIVPIISVSNKTGYYINVLKQLIVNLEPTLSWNDENEKTSDRSIFYIDSKFIPEGIGLVVSGILKGNSIKIGSELLIGPYGDQFRPVRVWSMHNNIKENISQLEDRHRGCLALRSIDKKNEVTRDNIRKGMIVISKDTEQNICLQFTASVQILNHSTIITKKYTPVIHCGIVRQSARIIIDDDKVLKMGDVATVEFRFIQSPEYIEKGMTFFFREGTTKGIGVVESVLKLTDDPCKELDGPKTKKKYVKRNRKLNKPTKTVKNSTDNSSGRQNRIVVI